MNYSELLKRGEKELMNQNIADASTDAWLLLSHVFHFDRNYYFLHMRDEADAGGADEYISLIGKRASHFPLQYITGEQEFMGYRFTVSPEVLIPRQDTEVLVECAVSAAKKLYEESKREVNILDICTGSGCIAVSAFRLLREMGISAKVYACDISDGALKVAAANAMANEAEVSFIKSDLLKDFSDKNCTVYGNFDIIISNPPYIKPEVIKTLMPEVRDYEPNLALDGGQSGVVFYEEITRQAAMCQLRTFEIFYEIGCEQAEEVSDILRNNGYKNIKVTKDLAGLNRVVSAAWLGQQ